jgi:TolB protein
MAQHAELELYATGKDTIPVAVLPFSHRGEDAAPPAAPEEIIAADLSFTGRFTIVEVPRIDTQLFREKNISLCIDGEYETNKGEITLHCNLHDAMTVDLLFGKKYRGKAAFTRNMAHRFANEVVHTLLGRKGVFESKIVFVKELGTRKHLYLMDYDGYNEKKLFTLPTVNIFPVFADSSTVLWTSYLRGKPDIYTGSLQTGKADILFYSRSIEVSPDVNRLTGDIVFASSRRGNLDIYRADADGGNITRLTDSYAIETAPCWSPNGYHIAFTSDRSGNPHIYIMDRDGANVRRLTFNGKYQDSPAWSPTGSQIAYACLQNGTFEIWSIKPDGSEEKRITDSPGNNEYPTWSPDGNHIAFVSTRGAQKDIFTIRKDGTGMRRITHSHNATMPYWQK